MLTCCSSVCLIEMIWTVYFPYFNYVLSVDLTYHICWNVGPRQSSAFQVFISFEIQECFFSLYYLTNDRWNSVFVLLCHAGIQILSGLCPSDFSVFFLIRFVKFDASGAFVSFTWDSDLWNHLRNRHLCKQIIQGFWYLPFVKIVFRGLFFDDYPESYVIRKWMTFFNGRE